MKCLLAAVLALSLLSCSTQSKDQKLITEYIKKNANDPASYEPVSFGEPHKFTMSEIPGGPAGDTTTVGVRIRHSYRAKNKMGALVLETSDFLVSRLNGDVLAIDTDGTTY
jgi:hypothetical protein